MAKSTVLDKAIRMCDVSREERRKNFNKVDRPLLNLFTKGTYEDLFALGDEIERMYANKEINKEDYRILSKHYAQAERWINARRRNPDLFKK